MVKKYLRPVSVLISLSMIMLPVRGYSLPAGEQLVAGSATFDYSQPDTLNINQASDKMIANYNSFSIGQSEAVHFVQPSASSIALNRVIGMDASSILGTLTANGRIFLINPNGVLFGQGCKIDTAGMVTSTLNIADSDFIAGKYVFYGSGGSVVNQGYISSPGGFVSLLGSSVENNGVIEANLGSIALASGKAITLNLDPKGMISVVIDEAAVANAANKDSAVKNTGTIKADGGKVFLTAKTLEGVFNKAVNNEGIIEADSLDDVNGKIELSSNGPISATGTLSASGGTIKVCTDKGLTLGGSYTADSIIFDPLWVTQTGTIDLNGDTTFWTTGDIDVLFDINNSSGLIRFFADNQDDVFGNFDNGVGDFNQAAATTISAKESVLISAANVNLDPGSKITVTPRAEDNHADIEIYAHGDLNTNNGVIDINNADLSAAVNGSGEAYIDVFGGDIMVDASSLKADVGGNADGLAAIHLGHDPEDPLGQGDIETHNISILNGSKLDAGVKNGNLYAYSTVDTDLTGSLNIENSELSAISGVTDPSGKGYAYLDFNLYGDEGNADIIGSTLLAKVNGEGNADISLYNSENNGYWTGVINQINGLFTDKGISSGPILGSVNISDSTLHAEAAGNSGFNFDAGTASIGMMSDGPITITGSNLSARELNAPATVGMLSNADINVDASSLISADTNNSLAAVGLLALGQTSTINALGRIRVDGGDNGLGLVAIAAMGDIVAADIIAAGQGDALPLLESYLDRYAKSLYKNAGVSFDRTQPFGLMQYSYGNAIALASLTGDVTLGNLNADAVLAAALGNSELWSGLIAALKLDTLIKLPVSESGGSGSIFDSGDVTAHILMLLARNDIGTVSAPIKTDVDILGALSIDHGDIFINEANNIELGVIAPLILHDSEGHPLNAFLGISVAANNGNIFIKSDGDMLVHSVLAPSGGVFLETTNGSIYAGKGWNPFSTFDLAKLFFKFDYLTQLNGSLGYSPAVLTFWDPAFGGTPYNVVAGGYSYLSSPNGGTIGLGTPGSKDPIMSGGIFGIVQPGTTAITGIEPAPGFDSLPSGFVMYQNEEASTGPQQIWPEGIGEGLTFENPLKVNIQLIESAGSAIPAGFTPEAALTLNFGIRSPEPVSNPENLSAILSNPLTKNLKAYYEILHVYRFTPSEPATPTNMFAYHPLTSMDMSAFDGITLDAGAYDFISNDLRMKKSLSPYFGQ